MEISSRTIISWFFHLHGSVRAKASKISCASSVTFSPMLSVCIVIVIVKERERERELSVDTKRPALEWYITERLDVPNTRRNNNIKQHIPFWDDTGCAIVHDHAEKNTQNARRRRSNEIESKEERIEFVPATNCAAFTAVSNRRSCLPLSMIGKGARSSSSLLLLGGGDTEFITFTVLFASQLIICTW